VVARPTKYQVLLEDAPCRPDEGAHRKYYIPARLVGQPSIRHDGGMIDFSRLYDVLTEAREKLFGWIQNVRREPREPQKTS